MNTYQVDWFVDNVCISVTVNAVDDGQALWAAEADVKAALDVDLLRIRADVSVTMLDTCPHCGGNARPNWEERDGRMIRVCPDCSWWPVLQAVTA